MGAYAASKFAAEAISEALAIEAAQFGVRVAIIEPGVVATPIFDKAMERPPNFESPYFGVTFRTSRLLLAGLASPASPDETADVIWRAITTDSPKLRHTVGADAARLSVERARLADEEWVAGFSTPDDAEWRANMLAWSGTEVPPM
jgi:NAD(P)-dependent dehydrogenase (short-subunit alcohol dehydrogenase family)